MTKIIFLDIDGVFNSLRTNFGLGPVPYKPVEEQRHRFDWCAVGLIRRLTQDDLSVKIVLSSTWRLGRADEETGLEQWELCAQFFDLPIIGRTDNLHTAGDDERYTDRGNQIQRWLDAHPEIEHYVIVDDDSDMLESQAPHFVQTTFREGFLYRHFLACQKILDGKLGGLYRRPRFWENRELCTEDELIEYDAKFERINEK